MAAEKMICPKCGAQMNHHADKVNYTIDLAEIDTVEPLGSILEEIHTCPVCRNVEVLEVGRTP